MVPETESPAKERDDGAGGLSKLSAAHKSRLARVEIPWTQGKSPISKPLIVVLATLAAVGYGVAHAVPGAWRRRGRWSENFRLERSPLVGWASGRQHTTRSSTKVEVGVVGGSSAREPRVPRDVRPGQRHGDEARQRDQGGRGPRRIPQAHLRAAVVPSLAYAVCGCMGTCAEAGTVRTTHAS